MTKLTQKELELFKRFINLSSQMKKAIFAPQITNEFTIGKKQLHAMSVLNDQGMMNMTNLAKGVGVSNQQLTKIVDVLVQKDMVERSYDSSNRRVVLVSLSKAGEDYINNMNSKIVDMIRNSGFPFDQKSLKEFDDHLKYMENFVKQVIGE